MFFPELLPHENCSSRVAHASIVSVAPALFPSNISHESPRPLSMLMNNWALAVQPQGETKV